MKTTFKNMMVEIHKEVSKLKPGGKYNIALAIMWFETGGDSDVVINIDGKVNFIDEEACEEAFKKYKEFEKGYGKRPRMYMYLYDEEKEKDSEILILYKNHDEE